jgi:hypothetical protein
MRELVRSRTALILVAIGLGLGVIGAVLNAVAALALTYYGGSSTSSNLATAGEWLLFSGAAVLLIAVCTVGWVLLVAERWSDLLEVGGAAVATLVFTIGTLLNATKSQGQSSSGSVVGAVGVGLWALLLVAVAARRATTRQYSTPQPFTPQPLMPQAAGQQPISRPNEEAPLWLVAAGGLILASISTGLSSYGGQGIASGVLLAVASVALLVAVAVARSKGLFTSPVTSTAVAGLGFFVAFGVAGAVSAAVLESATSLTAIKAVLSVYYFLEGLAFLGLGLAAWRYSILLPAATPLATEAGPQTTVYRPPPVYPPAPRPVPPDAAAPTAGTGQPAGGIAPQQPGPVAATPPVVAARFCTQCGSACSASARFCPSCGAQLQPS